MKRRTFIKGLLSLLVLPLEAVKLISKPKRNTISTEQFTEAIEMLERHRIPYPYFYYTQNGLYELKGNKAIKVSD